MNPPATGRAVKPPFGQVWLREDLESLAVSLQVSDDKRHFISSRWLESVLWMESAAQRTRQRYYALRLVTVVGAVILTALASSALGGSSDVVKWITFVVSLVVALSAAVDGFFRFGDRWRHYRGLVEELKSEGWSFHELSGPYRVDGATHETAYPTFVERVNGLLARETQTYIAEIAALAPSPPAQNTTPPDETAGAPDESVAVPDESVDSWSEDEGAPEEGMAAPDETTAPPDKTEP